MVNDKLSKKTIMQLGVAAVIIILILFIGVYFRGTGEAIEIGVTPFTGVADLTDEQSVVFSVLPTEPRSIQLRTSLSPFGLTYTPDDFLFTVFPIDSNIYGFNITLYDPVNDVNRETLVVDVLDVTGDSSRIYLKNNDQPESLDNVVDLVVELVAGEISITNRHYLSSTRYDIVLFKNDTTRNVHGPIIRVNSTGVLGMIANITGVEIIRPDVIIGVLPGEYNSTVDLVDWDLISDNPLNKNSTINVTWTAPGNAVAALLNVSLHVSDKIVNKYYRLSVENLTYNFSEPNLPVMNVTFKENHLSSSKDALLRVTFRATTRLQPFSPSCVLEDGELQELLNNPNVARIYWFDDATQEAQLAISNGPADTFPTEAFSGFFVKLAAAQKTKVDLDCEMKSLTPAVQRSTFQFEPPESLPVISRGWNLFALPGAISQSLTDFGVNGETVKVYECSVGGEVCPIIPDDQPLVPGKVYWVLSTERFTGSSVFS